MLIRDIEPTATPWFVAIGASGRDGLIDITRLLDALPSSLDAVVLIVFHRRWDHPTRLREVLARSSTLPVIVAAQGERFQPGSVYIGEPSEHLTLAARSFGEIVQDPLRGYSNRTVELLFRSVAAYGVGERIIGVVLSGSLDDGARGLAEIHNVGGLTMVLTPGLLPWNGMPENAIDYDGPIDFVGTPAEIAAAISKAVGRVPERPLLI